MRIEGLAVQMGNAKIIVIGAMPATVEDGTVEDLQRQISITSPAIRKALKQLLPAVVAELAQVAPTVAVSYNDAPLRAPVTAAAGSTPPGAATTL